MSEKIEKQEQTVQFSESRAIEANREKLTDEDVNDLRVLRDQLSQSKDWTAVSMDEILDDLFRPSSYSCIIREPLEDSESHIVATGQLVIDAENKVGTVENIVVNKDVRGKGLGKEIMQHLLEVAKERNLNLLQLTSNPSREAAHRLYKSLGFKIVGEKQKYDESGDPTYKTSLFELDLEN